MTTDQPTESPEPQPKELAVYEPPTTTLGSEPVVTNVAECDLAVDEFGRLDAFSKRVAAECTAECAEVKAKHKQRLFVTLPAAGGRVGFADRMKALEVAITKFVKKNAAKIVAKAGQKFRDFDCGRVTWKQTPAKLEPADGQTSATVLQTIVDKSGLEAKLAELLDSTTCGSVKLADLIDVKPQLKMIGMQNVKACTNVSVNPREAKASSERTSKAA